MFKKILIANRGEVALRILRACKEMGIKVVAVHSTADAQAMHVRLADESVCIGPPRSTDSYLNVSAILSAAEITNADAIHPGLGFLSESAPFARMVEEHGLTFIGPSAEHIRLMGDKIQAKKTAVALGLPVIPGSPGGITSAAEAKSLVQKMSFPVLIKAAGGGGGRGMKIAHDEDGLSQAIASAQTEALVNFGDASVYLEKYLTTPRHIEIQVIGDGQGNVLHLGERDCSLQRRHQKIWEESPSPAVSVELRETLGQKCCKALGEIRYKGVGTLEFLFEEGEFYFIEMNTRLQVEHPVTEMVTNIDLVQEQIRVAAGEPMRYTQDQIKWRGHAIECRINAEDSKTFTPSPGTILDYLAPGGPHVRIDSALYTGYEIPPYYDSLVSKLIVWGEDRQQALQRLRRALDEYVITGIQTLQPLHQRLVEEPDIQRGQYTIHWLEDFLERDR